MAERDVVDKMEREEAVGHQKAIIEANRCAQHKNAVDGCFVTPTGKHVCLGTSKINAWTRALVSRRVIV